MPHYAHMISVNRLQVQVHLGFYTDERTKLQPIEICFRLHFPEAPLCTRDDEGDFIDYGSLCKLLTDFSSTHDFKLIEFMGTELFRLLRANLDARGREDVKLWLRLNKVAAPVPGLMEGTSFTHCDLPAGATVSTND